MAFHPEFAFNGLFYVNYTDLSGNTIVSRFLVSPDPNVADATSEGLVLSIQQPADDHNGGQLQFGPDGYLYIATGDGTGITSGPNRGQDLLTLLGKILRIDVDGLPPYRVPGDNPFAEIDSALSEIWAYGLRNPWRFSFDRETGDMFIGDVGHASREEINFQPAASKGGENYGWWRMEGSVCFNPQTGRPFPDVPPETCNDGSLTLPIIEYVHPEGSCRSVTGGYVYRGADYPEFDGVYFYADFCLGQIWAAVRSEKPGTQGALWTSVGPRETGFRITTFGEDEQGRLYIADLRSRTVFRISADRPRPVISRLTPFKQMAGGEDFEITVVGSDFLTGTELRWDGESRPTEVIDDTRLRVTISAADLAEAHAVEITAFTPPPRGGLSEPVEFVIDEAADLLPAIYVGGAVSAATFMAGGAVVPGSIFSVFGVDMAGWLEIASATPLPTSLGGAVLVFRPGDAVALGSPASLPPDGEVRVPLVFGSAGQFNAQVPWELAGLAEATLTVQAGPAVSNSIAVLLTTYAPGLFTVDFSGEGQGAVSIAHTEGVIPAPVGSIPGAVTRPARPGEFLSIWCVGLGPVTNGPPSSEPSGTPAPLTTTQPTVTIGGVEAPIQFSGLSPGLVGLYQVNARVPEDAPRGEAVPLALTIGGVKSNTVTVAVE